MSDNLEKINQPNDIKQLSKEEYKNLATEIRKFLVGNVSKTGGHLASNLGVVELTMALHLCMDFPKDKLIWDVGHQAYTHKILTGRKNQFDSLRELDGLSGFPKMHESDCDSFDTGHSSTSISAALGYVKARELSGEDHHIAAVIGDGALSGGIAYEALNNAARIKSNMLIILNDNNMSISENVGGMASYLGKIRTNSKYQGFKEDVQNALKKIPKIGDVIVDKLKKSKDSIKRLLIPGMLFEDMGLTYIGPIDGHNIEQLVESIKVAQNTKEAVLLHVITKKGKGYKLAEKNPTKFHGIDPFCIKTGQTKTSEQGKTYTELFSDTMISMAKENEKICAVTAAMPAGTGLTKFSEEYKNRFFDVGIAEQHAVTFAAGLASGGYKPFVAIYSTFLQRAYDQIIHDVCICKLPVVFAIDRAGIVGKDGETHQGIYDISFLSHIPNLTIIAPKNGMEMVSMLHFSSEFNEPIAIRYPRGIAYTGLEDYNEPIQIGKSETIYKGRKIALLAVGSMVAAANKVAKMLLENGIEPTLINVRFISPIDEECLHDLAKNHTLWITMEENIKDGGFGEKIAQFICDNKYRHVICENISIPRQFVSHGDSKQLKKQLGLDSKSIYKKCKEAYDLFHL